MSLLDSLFLNPDNLESPKVIEGEEIPIELNLGLPFPMEILNLTGLMDSTEQNPQFQKFFQLLIGALTNAELVLDDEYLKNFMKAGYEMLLSMFSANEKDAIRFLTIIADASRESLIEHSAPFISVTDFGFEQPGLFENENGGNAQNTGIERSASGN